ncbi:MAG: aconitase X [Promethearchaeota archaeon]
MILTDDEKAILHGSQGEHAQKILRSIVAYGDMFDAKRLIKITGNPHFVMSMGVFTFKSLHNTFEEIVNAGFKSIKPFTVDPYPIDHKNVKSTFLQKLVFKIIFREQKHLEKIYNKMGMKDDRAFSCACYLPEVGNIPKPNDILTWSESSAVIYANSVCGARCNRNAGGIDILMALLGKTPEFGLLTDEGRKATWLIELRTTTLPHSQLLGSAIGLKVMEDVPYVKGLDTFLGTELSRTVKDYLKDFGAAAASNGAVGLYHIDNLTPEAVERGKTLLTQDFQTYIIDDQELERIFTGYPNIWKKKKNGKGKEPRPKKCFIGCPHLSFTQISSWINLLDETLKGNKVALETILLTAPDVKIKFEKSTNMVNKLKKIGAKISIICPLMFMANPLCKDIPIVTNSNKLRTYTSARFFRDEELIQIIRTGELPEDL